MFRVALLAALLPNATEFLVQPSTIESTAQSLNKPLTKISNAFLSYRKVIFAIGL